MHIWFFDVPAAPINISDQIKHESDLHELPSF